MKRELVKKLLDTKKPDIAEIEVTLFENCHLDCDFCGHAKKSTVGVSKEEIMSKVPLMTNFLKTISPDVDTVLLQLVGGELLQDYLIDDGFLDHYHELISLVDIAAQYENKKLKVKIVTANLTSRKEEVKAFLDNVKANGMDIEMIVSYDLVGRPMGERWRQNLTYFQEYIYSINTVVTKQAIRKLIDEGDPYFHYLYNNFEIFMDNFIPDVDTSHMVPSDDEHLEFLKFMSSNYSSVHPISRIVNIYKHNSPLTVVKMDCMSLNKVTIFPDNSTSNCRWKRYEQKDFINDLVYEDNSNMMLDFMNTNDCLNCRFYQKCPFTCYTQWSWKDRERSIGCVNKKWFEYLEKKDWHQNQP